MLLESSLTISLKFSRLINFTEKGRQISVKHFNKPPSSSATKLPRPMGKWKLSARALRSISAVKELLNRKTNLKQIQIKTKRISLTFAGE